jgi:hypothetical protein
MRQQIPALPYKTHGVRASVRLGQSERLPESKTRARDGRCSSIPSVWRWTGQTLATAPKAAVANHTQPIARIGLDRGSHDSAQSWPDCVDRSLEKSYRRNGRREKRAVKGLSVQVACVLPAWEVFTDICASARPHDGLAELDRMTALHSAYIWRSGWRASAPRPSLPCSWARMSRAIIVDRRTRLPSLMSSP